MSNEAELDQFLGDLIKKASGARQGDQLAHRPGHRRGAQGRGQEGVAAGRRRPRRLFRRSARRQDRQRSGLGRRGRAGPRNRVDGRGPRVRRREAVRPAGGRHRQERRASPMRAIPPRQRRPRPRRRRNSCCRASSASQRRRRGWRPGRRQTGRWARQGNKIVLYGA